MTLNELIITNLFAVNSPMKFRKQNVFTAYGLHRDYSLAWEFTLFFPYPAWLSQFLKFWNSYDGSSIGFSKTFLLDLYFSFLQDFGLSVFSVSVWSNKNFSFWGNRCLDSLPVQGPKSVIFARLVLFWREFVYFYGEKSHCFTYELVQITPWKTRAQ